MSEIEALHLTQEVRLKKHIKTISATDKVFVNIATSDIKDKTNTGRNSQNYSGNFRGGYQGCGNQAFGRGHGHSNRNGGCSVTCQLCNKPGHVVMNCFYRFDHNFQGKQHRKLYCIFIKFSV